GRPFAVPDLHGSPDVSRRLVSPSSSVSALFLPVAWDSAVRRVALIGWHTPNPVDQDTIDLAELLCDTAAAGFSRIEESERRAAGAEQDRAVVRAGRALNESLDLHEVLNTLAREVALVLGADFAGVYLGDAESGAIA